MSERHGRDWARMTPDDFDRDAPLRTEPPGGRVPVPAVSDEYGTPPLFGDETSAPGAARPRRRTAVSAEQEELF
ncbi:hypothetical protein ACFU6S_02715 [Streptomyces sp. NPDC057456]|uniref:hypothetical protein n=1 Tax=Streptomyces sp. NPDC057456 TaxID=3346139 RepID=UPI0036755E76